MVNLRQAQYEEIIMKTEQEIREEIEKITNQYKHVLTGGLATVQVNTPRAMLQIEAITSLNRLYWVLGEERPSFPMDNKKINT
jgi:hypothetical protein